MSVTSVKKRDVSAFLQGSAFYCSLDLEAEEEITVPADCFKSDDVVNNAEDFRTLLYTLRFWALSECPYTLVCYLLSSADREVNLEIMAQFQSELRYLVPLRALIYCPDADRLELAIVQDNTDATNFLLLNGAEVNAACFNAACQLNRFEMLQQIISKCDKSWLNRDIVFNLNNKGLVPMIQYLHDEGFDIAHPHAALAAATDGNVELLRIYLDLQSPVVGTISVCWVAAYRGHLECLQLACERSLFPEDGSHIMEMVCEKGHINILIYLHKRGERLHVCCCSNAAGKGHLAILQYLHENGCAWKAEACTQAAFYGRLSCLQYLHEQGCPWVENLFATVARYGESHVCLRYLLEHGCNAYAESTMEFAVKCGYVDVLQVLTEFGYLLFPSLCALAMQYNQLACLAYLHEHCVEWGDTNTDEAAKEGYLGCIAYAHDYGCPWGPETCSNAAQYGHLTCLQYAYEHGAPWDIKVYKDSRVYRHPECKSYIFEQLLQLGEVFEMELPPDLPRRRDLL